MDIRGAHLLSGVLLSASELSGVQCPDAGSRLILFQRKISNGATTILVLSWKGGLGKKKCRSCRIDTKPIPCPARRRVESKTERIRRLRLCLPFPNVMLMAKEWKTSELSTFAVRGCRMHARCKKRAFRPCDKRGDTSNNASTRGH
ncbi:hypothetical protein C8Q78DRAFT_254038 [Trametes maxima]|nr:hypothetical protein C8Q78DRAFT_254038 [Trametes maxima]